MTPQSLAGPRVRRPPPPRWHLTSVSPLRPLELWGENATIVFDEMLFDVTDPVTRRTQELFYLLIHFLRSLPSNGFEIGEVKKRENFLPSFGLS